MYVNSSLYCRSKRIYTDKSSDPDKEPIVAHEWMTSLDSVKKAADINTLFLKRISWRIQSNIVFRILSLTGAIGSTKLL